jgi:hypothetical protein
MHALANKHLDRFQIDASGLTAVGKDPLGETLYFASDFLLDRFDRFFSCCDSVSGSDGRN